MGVNYIKKHVNVDNVRPAAGAGGLNGCGGDQGIATASESNRLWNYPPISKGTYRGPFKAFDNGSLDDSAIVDGESYTGFWQTYYGTSFGPDYGINTWLSFEFPEAKYITKYALWARVNNTASVADMVANNLPKNWVIQGSNDDMVLSPSNLLINGSFDGARTGGVVNSGFTKFNIANPGTIDGWTFNELNLIDNDATGRAAWNDPVNMYSSSTKNLGQYFAGIQGHVRYIRQTVNIEYSGTYVLRFFATARDNTSAAGSPENIQFVVDFNNTTKTYNTSAHLHTFARYDIEYNITTPGTYTLEIRNDYANGPDYNANHPDQTILIANVALVEHHTSRWTTLDTRKYETEDTRSVSYVRPYQYSDEFSLIGMPYSEYKIQNPGSYKHYRLYNYLTNDVSGIAIGELAYYESHQFERVNTVRSPEADGGGSTFGKVYDLMVIH